MKINDGTNREISHSQNFIKDPLLVTKLIKKTNISINDLVVEIGPGKGLITAELAKHAKNVIGVEYDFELASLLKARFATLPNVKIIQADFLKWDLPDQEYKVFANIPFNLTADIVRKLLTAKNPPLSAYLIMQDSAAERFVGPPISMNTQISVLLKSMYEISVLDRINKWEFKPIPKVNAALVEFKKMSAPLIDPNSQQIYRDFVIYGYNQWKPNLLEAFEKVFTAEQLSSVSERFGLQGLKPTEVPIDKWVGLFDFFVEMVPNVKKGVVLGSEERLKVNQRSMTKSHRTRR